MNKLRGFNRAVRSDSLLRHFLFSNARYVADLAYSKWI
jgi:hypothetical protein